MARVLKKEEGVEVGVEAGDAPKVLDWIENHELRLQRLERVAALFLRHKHHGDAGPVVEVSDELV